MVELYGSATTYGDQGRIRIQGNKDGQRIDQQAKYLVAMEKPGKIRVQAHQGIIVADGENLWAYVVDLRNQVLQRSAPDQITLSSLLVDDLLTAALAQPSTQVYCLVPVQALLLLADDPLKTLLHDARDVKLVSSAAIDNATCYRVEVTRPDGKVVFWIDEESYLLRRLEFPTVELNKAIAGGAIRDFSIVADFTGAKVGQGIDPNAFVFETPEDAELVDSLLTPELYLLGRPAPEFTFVDLDGNEVTPSSLAGKVTVIDFWATWCRPCRDSLPVLERVYRETNAGDRLTVLAVSVDNPDVNDDQLRSTFSELGVNLPIARDPQQAAGNLFNVSGIPAMVILGAEGKVQDMEAGFHANYATALSAKFAKLLAGEEIYRENLDDFEAQGEQMIAWLQERARKEEYWGPLAPSPMPTAEIAEESLPQKIKLRKLWSSTGLRLPGNILVVQEPDKADRILVLDNEASIAQLGTGGSVTASHPLPVEAGEPIRFLRTGAANDGTRWFAASTSGAPRLHLLNDAFEPLLEFPPQADVFTHPGIADVQIGDLDNDGTPELCVGYWGDVGVQGVSVEGERIWRNRTLANVPSLALLGLDSSGQRNVLCTNQTGSLVLIDAEGNRVTEIQVPSQPVIWIVSADLDGDDQVELCALSPTQEGSHVALGLNLQGEVLWEYPLPAGMHEHAIEPVQPARLLSGQPGQWLLAGPDGSIHILSPTGEPMDRFNYGAALTGLATAALDGKPVLLVATTESVDAWEVEGP
jgi:thiol-disulfide isomerase/thioredoxin/outer membrane lipoprotein-sorting protein